MGACNGTDVELETDTLSTNNVTVSSYHSNSKNEKINHNSEMEKIANKNSDLKIKGEDQKVKEECVICLESYSNKKIKTTLDCKHNFCNICLDYALAVKPCCPLCRKYQFNIKDNKKISQNAQWDIRLIRIYVQNNKNSPNCVIISVHNLRHRGNLNRNILEGNNLDD